ncbi:MAG: hypothetical protein EXS14_02545 [Planctomycetes bacterium]|nr:hypothetical protein [Planctomycetota bacterium]
MISIAFLIVGVAGLRAQEAPLSEQARELLQSTDVAVAALRAEGLRQGGPEKRAELMRVLQDPGLPEHVLQGVLTALVERNDRAEKTLDILVVLYARAEGPARERLRATLLRYDAKGSVLNAPLAGLVGTGPIPAAILDLTVLLADSAEEKRDATAALIARLQREPQAATAAALHASLAELTFHRYSKPTEWAHWYEQFHGTHPSGFTVRDLAMDAVQEAGRVEREQRLAEALRAIAILAAAKVLPSEYLDPVRTPDVELRLAAAAAMADAASGDAQRCDDAFSALKRALASDGAVSVCQAAVKSLGKLAQEEPRLATAIANVLTPLLAYEDGALLRSAVVALRQCQVEIVPVLSGLYLRLLQQGEKSVESRREVVAALAGKSSGAHMLLEAMKDKDAAVRRTAALGLALGSGDTHAEDLARLLADEGDTQVAQSLLKCLVHLGQWQNPEVTHAVLRLLSGDLKLRVEAAAALVAALGAAASVSPQGAEREAVLAALDGFWKLGLPDLAARLALSERLQQSPLSQGASGVVLGWILGENDRSAAQSLTVVLAGVRPVDPVLLLGAAERLMQSGRNHEAELLLQTLLAPESAEHSSPEQVTVARRRLIDSLMGHAEETDLRQLEALLDAEAKLSPGSKQLARDRATLRFLQKRWKDALAELATGLDGEESTLTPAQLERLLSLGVRAALECGEVGVALAHLARFGDLGARTELRFMKARALFLSGKPVGALQELAAISPVSAGVPNEMEFLHLRVEASLLQPATELRLRAAEDYARLVELNGGAAIAVLEVRVNADAAARAAVIALDGAVSVEEAFDQVEALQKLGAPVATAWLLTQLNRFPLSSNEGQRGLGQRVLALQRLYPNRDGLRQLIPPHSEAAAGEVLRALERFAGALEQN